MDPRYSAQDVLRCHLCDVPVPPLCCDICHIYLCKACAGEHILDASKKHKVIPMKQSLSEPIYPKCTKHSPKDCELYCKHCTIPICVQCVSSHQGHKIEELLKSMDSKKKNLQKDLMEMESSILIKYKEIATGIPRQKAYLHETADSLKTAIDEHGKKLHEQVYAIVKKLKSEVDKKKEKQLSFLKEEDIARKISDIEEYIVNQKELQTSRDLSLIYEHKSRKEEFANVPVKHNVTLPTFSANDIDMDQLLQQFGSLTDKTKSGGQREKTKIREEEREGRHVGYRRWKEQERAQMIREEEREGRLAGYRRWEEQERAQMRGEEQERAQMRGEEQERVQMRGEEQDRAQMKRKEEQEWVIRREDREVAEYWAAFMKRREEQERAIRES